MFKSLALHCVLFCFRFCLLNSISGVILSTQCKLLPRSVLIFKWHYCEKKRTGFHNKWNWQWIFNSFWYLGKETVSKNYFIIETLKNCINYNTCSFYYAYLKCTKNRTKLSAMLHDTYHSNIECIQIFVKKNDFL